MYTVITLFTALNRVKWLILLKIICLVKLQKKKETNNNKIKEITFYANIFNYVSKVIYKHIQKYAYIFLLLSTSMYKIKNLPTTDM